jgi:NAD(P)-dependent dehydrogenase (short-subunit alcohol dehydrogenase family)
MPTVAITGASAGVGRATAICFAAQGWHVGLIARGEEGLAAAQRDVERFGGVGLAVPADVADAGQVVAAADRIAGRWGGIDLWINNAMATVFAPVDAVSSAEFQRVTAVTYLGQVHGTLAALRHMRPHDRGTIVQVGSALSYRSIPLQAAYCAAKAAVRGFTDSLRSELIHQRSRIRLVMVQLPAVNTPQFDWARSRLRYRPQPVPPIYQPEAIARAILHAACTAPRELWIGASTLQAIMGTQVAPGLLDRLLARRAWQGKMTSETADPEQPDNLERPVPGDFGAHGRFDARASASPAWFSPPMVRGAALFAGFTLAAGAGVAAARLTRPAPDDRPWRLGAPRYSGRSRE